MARRMEMESSCYCKSVMNEVKIDVLGESSIVLSLQIIRI